MTGRIAAAICGLAILYGAYTIGFNIDDCTYKHVHLLEFSIYGLCNLVGNVFTGIILFIMGAAFFTYGAILGK